jgi:hypothetical protein
LLLEARRRHGVDRCDLTIMMHTGSFSSFSFSRSLSCLSFAGLFVDVSGKLNLVADGRMNGAIRIVNRVNE